MRTRRSISIFVSSAPGQTGITSSARCSSRSRCTTSSTAFHAQARLPSSAMRRAYRSISRISYGGPPAHSGGGCGEPVRFVVAARAVHHTERPAPDLRLHVPVPNSRTDHAASIREDARPTRWWRLAHSTPERWRAGGAPVRKTLEILKGGQRRPVAAFDQTLEILALGQRRPKAANVCHPCGLQGPGDILTIADVPRGTIRQERREHEWLTGQLCAFGASANCPFMRGLRGVRAR